MDHIHGGYIFDRRIRRLAAHLADLLPQNADVLDVGCGDGSVAALVIEKRPDLRLRGIDVFVREKTAIPVEPFDGIHLPYRDKSFDAVTFVDVLHHTEDPIVLLREAARVARKAIVIKDHTADGFLANVTLRYMDRVGNARHGVVLPFNYWPKGHWLRAFEELGLQVTAWRKNLGLYPWPASMVFGRSLHFCASLTPAS